MKVQRVSMWVFFYLQCLLMVIAAGRLLLPEERLRDDLAAYKYNKYITFDKMEERVKQLARAYPFQVKLEIAGKSVKNRNIYLLIITDNVQRSKDISIDSSSTAGGQVIDVAPPEGGSAVNESRESLYEPTNRIPIYPKPIVFSQTKKLKEDSKKKWIELPSDDNHSEESHEDTRWKRSALDPSNRKPFNRLPPTNSKPVIFVDGGVHAREWVSPAAVFYVIDQLLKTRSFTSDLEWRLMPMVNPDGYHFSHTARRHRMWRKNRAKTTNSNCLGVDLNRNFDVFWEETNHQYPCSETFSGTHPFSEPESRAIRDELLKVQDRVQAYVTVHTYGQLFLYPFGYTKNKEPATVEKLKKMANGMAKAIYNKYSNEYLVRQASVLGAAAGGSDDWAFLKVGVPYSYTFELQDKVSERFDYNSRGFDLAKWKLPQAVDECWIALKHMATQIMQEQGITLKSSTLPQEAIVRQTPPVVPLSKPSAVPYPVGWSQIMKEVRRIRTEARENPDENPSGRCIQRGALFVCPHMVFWGSMFSNFGT